MNIYPYQPHPLAKLNAELGEESKDIAKFLAPKNSKDIKASLEIDEQKVPPYKKFCMRHPGIFEMLWLQSEFRNCIQRRCERYISYLDDGFNGGHINAVREVVFLAVRATELLKSWAEKDADLLSAVAQDYSKWPVFSNGKSISPSELAMLKKIRLDAARREGAPTEKIGNDPTVPRQWALLLLKLIRQIRELHGIYDRKLTLGADTTISSSSANDKFPGSDMHNGLLSKKPNLRSLHEDRAEYFKIADVAKKLTPFNRENSRQWWKLAKTIFLLVTNDRPWEFPGLDGYAKTSKVKTLKNSDGTKRSEVLKAIEPAFIRLAST